ncbi:MAG: hypothetical protein A2X94_09150 [Bdellovibrionales bacterium GWB1_55_8]|nr:MAG: hypothetical protein A2X94_09150 [Bdellovibrionales bacterium GWB1_55_8]
MTESRCTISALLITIFGASGCAHLYLPGDKVDHIKRAKIDAAIVANDAKTVSTQLTEKSYFSYASGPDRLNGRFGHELIQRAVIGPGDWPSDLHARPDGVCRTPVIKALLDKGAKPGAAGMKKAAQALCPDVVEALVSRADSDQLTLAAGEFATYFQNQFSSDSSPDPETVEKLGKSLLSFKTGCEEHCKRSGPSSPACKTAETVTRAAKTVIALEESREQEEQFRASPAGIQQTGCELQAEIEAAQGVIDSEKQSAAISGFVNREKMYYAGKKIQKLTGDLIEVREVYRKTAKKPLNLKNCK